MRRQAAIERAKLLMDILDVELWDGKRKIAVFKPPSRAGKPH